MKKKHMGESSEPKWRHSGGKLREKGAQALSDAELLAVLIGTGIKGKSADAIAEEILSRFGSFRGMANQPFERFKNIQGLGDVKIIRIAAAFEIARRAVNDVLRELDDEGHISDIEPLRYVDVENRAIRCRRTYALDAGNN